MLNPGYHHQLLSWLSAAWTSSPTELHQIEKHLNSASTHADFVKTLIFILSNQRAPGSSSTQQIPPPTAPLSDPRLSPPPSPPTEQTALLASISLRNHVKKVWDALEAPPSDGGSINEDKGVGSSSGGGPVGSSLHPVSLSASDRALLQANIPTMILSVYGYPSVRRQLLDTLEYMTQTDFPDEWSDLLSWLVNDFLLGGDDEASKQKVMLGIDARFNSMFGGGNGVVHSTDGRVDGGSSYSSQGGLPIASTSDGGGSLSSSPIDSKLSFVISSYEEARLVALKMLHKILKKYSTASMSDETLCQLEIILGVVAAPLLKCATNLMKMVGEADGGDERVRMCRECSLFYCFKIFYSLNFVDFPEFFEDNISTWFELFSVVLRMEFSGGEERGIRERLKTQCCRNLTLYGEKYQEALAPMVFSLVELVWSFFTADLSAPKYDGLVLAAIKFIASVSQTRWDHAASEETQSGSWESGTQNLFLYEAFLSSLCDRVIVPSVHLRDADIEMMEDSPLEFVRSEMEASESFSRRTAALDLINSLIIIYSAQVTTVLLRSVTKISAEYSKYTGILSERFKDSCASIMLALAVKGKASFNPSASVINEKIDFVTFFNAELLPELVATPLDTRLICRYSALKCLATYGRHFDRGELTHLLPTVAKQLTARNVVLYTYAAICLERLLAMKEADGSPKILQNSESCEVLLDALRCLLRILYSTVSVNENEYIIKCVMRITCSLKVKALPIVIDELPKLAELVKLKAANPRNPLYNHFLFETIGMILRLIPPDKFAEPEKLVLVVFVQLLEQGSHDFIPYCLQLLGLMLDISSTNPEPFARIFEIVADASLWHSSMANAPGLIRLLCSYLRKYNIFSELINANLGRILSQFQFCINHSKLYNASFILLNGIIRFLPASVYDKYLQTLLTVLLMKMRESKSRPAMRRNVVVSISLLIYKQDHPDGVNQKLEQIQAGLADNFILYAFLPNVSLLKSIHDKKVVALALAKLLYCQCFASKPEVLNQFFGALSTVIGGEEFAAISGDSLRKVRAAQMEESEAQATYVDSLAYDDDRQQFDVTFAKLGSADVDSKDLLPEVTDVKSIIRGALQSNQDSLVLLYNNQTSYSPLVALVS